jgi:hypothetical protein
MKTKWVDKNFKYPKEELCVICNRRVKRDEQVEGKYCSSACQKEDEEESKRIAEEFFSKYEYQDPE